MTVSRPEYPLSDIAGPGSEDPCRTALPRALLSWPPTTRFLRAPCSASFRSRGSLAVRRSGRHQAPGEGAELPRHGGDRDLGGLAPAHEAAEAAVERLLRPPGDGRHGGGLAPERLANALAECRAVAVAPGRLDEEAADVAVAGLGDPAALLLAAARVLLRH